MLRRGQDNDVSSGGGKVYDVSYNVKISLTFPFAGIMYESDHTDLPSR